MAKNILRRCSTCGKYHASYRVEDPATGQILSLCYTCWKARFNHPTPKEAAEKQPSSTDEESSADQQGINSPR